MNETNIVDKFEEWVGVICSENNEVFWNTFLKNVEYKLFTDEVKHKQQFMIAPVALINGVAVSPKVRKYSTYDEMVNDIPSVLIPYKLEYVKGLCKEYDQDTYLETENEIEHSSYTIRAIFEE